MPPTAHVFHAADWPLAELFAAHFPEARDAAECLYFVSPKAARRLGDVSAMPVARDGSDLWALLARGVLRTLPGQGEGWLCFKALPSSDPDDEESIEWALEGLGGEVTRGLPKPDWREVDARNHPCIWTAEDAWEFWNQEHDGPSQYPWKSIAWSPLRDDVALIQATAAQYASGGKAETCDLLLDLASCVGDEMRPGPYLLQLQQVAATGELSLSEAQHRAVAIGVEALLTS